MLVKRYGNVEVRITMSGPGDIVAVTFQGPDGKRTEPHYFPNEAWAVREIEAAMNAGKPGPSKASLALVTVLMLVSAAFVAGAIVHWLASLPAAILMALFLLGRG